MSPRQVHFAGMEADERIIAIWRRHVSVVAGATTRAIILLVLPFAVIVAVDALWYDLSLSAGGVSIVALVLGLSAYVLLVGSLFFRTWLDYYLDAFIVTSERIVRIEQRGLFDRIVSSLRLDRIQDITVETKGVLSTFMKFGTINVQTAGEQERFTFTTIPNPEAVKQAILEAAERYSAARPAPASPPPPAARPPTTGTPAR